MDLSALEEKSSFKMLGLTVSSKLDWCSYIISIAEIVSNKIGALIRYIKFLSPEVALCHYKSTIHSPMYRILSSSLGWCPYLLLGNVRQATKTNIQKPSLAASLEPLALRGNVASLSLFYRYYFGRCLKLAQLVPLPFSRGRSTRYSDRLHDFSVTIPRCYNVCHDSLFVSFFPRTATLWNSLPLECFPSTYDLSGFKSRFNRDLLTVGSF